MSLIRKPVAAERESSFRRTAEATIAGGRIVRDLGREAGVRTARGFGKVTQVWLLVGFTFGALTASSPGAKALGLLILSPFWYFALRKRNPRASTGAGSMLRKTPAPAPAPVPAPTPVTAESSFDPDLVIQRYLAQKESEPSPVVGLGASPQRPHPPVFGKRVLRS